MLNVTHENKRRRTRPPLGQFCSARALREASRFVLADLIQRDKDGGRRSGRGDTLFAAIQSADVVVQDVHVAIGKWDLHSNAYFGPRAALNRMLPVRQETPEHWALRLMAGLIGMSLAPIDRVLFEHPMHIGPQSKLIFDVHAVDEIGKTIAIEAGAAEPDKIIGALENSVDAVMVLPYAGLKQHYCLGWAFQLNPLQAAQEHTQPLMITRTDIDRAINRLVPNAISDLN